MNLTRDEMEWLQTFLRTIIKNEKNVYFGLLFQGKRERENWVQARIKEFDSKESSLDFLNDSLHIGIKNTEGLVILKLFLKTFNGVEATLRKHEIMEEISLTFITESTIYTVRFWEKTISNFEMYKHTLLAADLQNFPTLKINIDERYY